MSEQTLEALEQRVIQLERSFGINPDTVVDVIHERSLSQQVAALEERLNTNLKEGTKKNVQSKLKKYEVQREFLEQVQKDPTFLLTIDEKGRLLSMYEGEIDETLKDLEKVKGLSKYLDFPPITEMEKKLETLEPIEIDFAGQTTEYLDQEEKFREVLEIYNQSIREINLQFMYLESLVTKLEHNKK